MKIETVVLDVDDRGRISVGKLLGGVSRVLVTADGTGRLLVEPAVVIRALGPRIRENPALVQEINDSFKPNEKLVARKPRPTRAV
jgi:hypothetical protein